MSIEFMLWLLRMHVNTSNSKYWINPESWNLMTKEISKINNSLSNRMNKHGYRQNLLIKQNIRTFINSAQTFKYVVWFYCYFFHDNKIFCEILLRRVGYAQTFPQFRKPSTSKLWCRVFFLHFLNVMLLKITCMKSLIFWMINPRHISTITMWKEIIHKIMNRQVVMRRFTNN